MRYVFVDHKGKLELTAIGGGSIHSANYDDLIGQLSDKIENNTKGGMYFSVFTL